MPMVHLGPKLDYQGYSSDASSIHSLQRLTRSQNGHWSTVHTRHGSDVEGRVNLEGNWALDSEGLAGGEVSTRLQPTLERHVH